ncbi:hypothetical protein TRFO_24036 [Tritrichomonas foetus]|uniref:Uncharacterized protein n=1 Tax=Tritrichomonas foetus TaxID=1144522 RepID=A0A1J4KDJ0_9EUKA|nr:hypothetical protein TRFO_24036 [Tritrichomonas foetus]|eukprot:OHT07694.1 hypothetical protein TRFO_24036 [Tritrichomonas foetus]
MMIKKKKEPPEIRPPFSSRSTQQVNFNISPKLPFSLRDPLIIEAMDLSGIKASDLDVLPLQHFINASPSEEIAKMSFQRQFDKRNDIINQIQENYQKVMKTKNTEQYKDSGELVYERHMANVHISQLNDKEQTNQAILRRLAINQMRQALKIQKDQQTNQKVDILTKNYQEKLDKTLAKAKYLTENTKFCTKGPGKYDDCLFYGKITTRALSRNDEMMRQKKYKDFLNQRDSKYSNEVKTTMKKTIKVKQKQEKEFDNLISHRLERVDKTDYRYSLIEGKFNERDRKLNERGEKRAIHTIEVNKRNDEIEKRRVERAMNKMNYQTIKSKEVLQQNKEIMNEKIEKERQILEKRNKAADQIFSARRKKIEDFDSYLSQRDVQIEDRLQQQKLQEIKNLYQIKNELEDKTAQILRKKRANECAVLCSLREKVSRKDTGLNEARYKRAKSQFSKVVCDDQFSEKRSQVMSLLPRLINMSDEDRVQILIDVLDIADEEAIDILNVARTPPSLH